MVVLFGVLPYIINVHLSKYFVTFETTIWHLWELRFSREFPAREDFSSDDSGSRHFFRGTRDASGSSVDWQPR